MLRTILPALLVAASAVLASCTQPVEPAGSERLAASSNAADAAEQTQTTTSNSMQSDVNPSEPRAPTQIETATFGAGCFWCVEAVLEQLVGVESVTSGYMGGRSANPTYQDVCTGLTGHAEVVAVRFDPSVIRYADLVDVFWDLHDPTTLNRQGADSGTQYRSAIFFHSEAQRVIAEEAKRAAAANFSSPIVTEITAATTFYPAEEYHQGYYGLNKDKNPYCRAVITPKLKKLGLKQ